jgi:hypothetical protein
VFVSERGGPFTTDSFNWMVKRAGQKADLPFQVHAHKRLANRVQLTSDGHKAYLEAVEGAFGSDIDYAMLVKVYGPALEGAAPL